MVYGKTKRMTLEKIFSNYFSNIFATSQPSDIDAALCGVSAKVTDEANNILIVKQTLEEVKTALFHMHLNISPRIDGMHGLFYQRF